MFRWLLLTTALFVLSACGDSGNGGDAGTTGTGTSGAGTRVAAPPSDELMEKCPGLALAMQQKVEPPGDIGVPVPDDALLFYSHGGGEMRVNNERFTTLPMVRYMTREPIEALRRFYDERLDSSWRRDTMLGQPVFYKAEGVPEGQDAMTALMSKPGTRPSIVFAPADECDQELLEGAQTTIEIVYEKNTEKKR